VKRLRARLAVALACALGPLIVADAAAADRIEPATLRIDWVPRAYHSPFFLGIAKGWYRDAGIDLTITEGRGSGNVVQLVGNRSDTFGFAGADAVVRAVQRGVPVVSVATIMPKNADAIFVLKSSGITRVQELKAKKIGTTVGGTADTLLPAFLKGAGIAIDEVAILPLDAAVKAQALMQGKIDAMNGPVWSIGNFSAVGGANAFAYADYGVQVVGYGIVVNVETTKMRPDLIRRFVEVSLRAWDYARRHPEEALSAYHKAVPEQAKPELVERDRTDVAVAFKLVQPAVTGMPFGVQSESDWEAMQRQLIEYGAIKQMLPVSQYLTQQFVR
jgi:NitT/TauT family transport system substrate-binding protein